MLNIVKEKLSLQKYHLHNDEYLEKVKKIQEYLK